LGSAEGWLRRRPCGCRPRPPSLTWDFWTLPTSRWRSRGSCGWPTRTDRYGDFYRPAALLALRRGRLDAAESLAAASVRRCEGISQIACTHSGVVLATIHVRAGEPDGLRLAHGAITAVTKISSVRVRKRLLLLADALAARPGADAKDLSRMALQVAGVRA
jgi:hypothetical protein